MGLILWVFWTNAYNYRKGNRRTFRRELNQIDEGTIVT